ncbi:MAG: pyridoxamine 5'-phosphate oxidase family protein [Promethearchaeati archaeon]
MEPIKLPQMTEKEIKSVIKKNNICRIAFIDGVFPYIAPFQYVYANSTLYFHFTDYGKKKKILERNNNVCVSIEDLKPDLSTFYFITIQAELTEVSNEEEREKIKNTMVSEGKSKFSTNFLSAHGFEKNEEWEILKNEKIRIFKLINFKKRLGLKSP